MLRASRIRRQLSVMDIGSGHHLVNSVQSEKEHRYSDEDYNHVDGRIWSVFFLIRTCKAFLNGTIGKNRSIVDNVRYDTRNNTFRSPEEPAVDDTTDCHSQERHRCHVNRTENYGRQQNGYPRVATHTEQSAEKHTSESYLFGYRSQQADIQHA